MNVALAAFSFAVVTSLIEILVAPTFSYQAIVSSLKEEDTISKSPSPSRSAKSIPVAKSASVLTIVFVQVGFTAPSFRNSAIVSSSKEAVMISKSPSKSISPTLTSSAPSTFVAISTAVQVGSVSPLFSYHATVSSSIDTETISRSPSLSKSAKSILSAPSALVAISTAVKVGLASPLFSYQAIVLSIPEAETISRSPSPSISATFTS